MASFFNMKGTTQNDFQLGLKGPILSRHTATNFLSLPGSIINKLYLGAAYNANSYIDASQYTGNAATATKVNQSLTITDSTGSVTYDGGTARTINLTSYLKTTGGDLTGKLSFATDKQAIEFRSDNPTYYTHVSYQTSGNEALVFGTKNTVTSFIFANGEDPALISSTRWTSITPGLQIKNNCVSIGKLIPSGTTPTYKLDVNGKANATELYEGGVAISTIYLGIEDTAKDSEKLNGQAASYYLDYNNFTNTPSLSYTDTDASTKTFVTGITATGHTITVSRKNLAATDIPSLDASKIGSGTMAMDRLPKADTVTNTSSLLPTAAAVYAYASPKAGSSSLTTYSGGTLAAAAAKGVIDNKTGITASASAGVTTGKAVYEYVADKIKGVYQFKGTIANVIEDSPSAGEIDLGSTAEKVNGYVYNITNAFTYKGTEYPAGTNVVYEDESDNGTADGSWKPLGGIFNIDSFDFQPKDADLTAIAGLSGNSGFLKKTAANTWSLDTSNYAGSATAGGPATSVALEQGTSDQARYVYFANTSASTSVCKPVYNDKFKFNPASGVLTATTFKGALDGNAATATSATTATSAGKWTTARNIKIGSKSQSVDGSADVTYTLEDIGAAATSHSHGNIASGGTVSSAVVTIANGDALLITDASNSHKVERSLTFDGSTTGSFLTKKGTWETAVTSVTVTAGTGISVSDSGVAIKGSGARTITNTGVLQVLDGLSTATEETTGGGGNGTIRVNTGGTWSYPKVYGLGSNAYTSTSYLPLSGGTMIGVFNLKENLYRTASTPTHGMNANNSDIIGINSLYTSDAAENTSEGIRFYRDESHWDTLTISGGNIYFMPNDSLAGSQFSSANQVLHSGNYSTWASPKAGSTSITTVGTISTGTWQGTKIGLVYLDNAVVDKTSEQALTNKTYNGLEVTPQATGYTIKGGNTTKKTLTVDTDYKLSDLGDAAKKSVVTSISSGDTSTNLPTAKAVATFMTATLASHGGIDKVGTVTQISTSGTGLSGGPITSSGTITLDSSALGNAAANKVVIRNAAGSIQTEKLAVSVGSATKATMQYNSTDECIEFVFI